MDSNSLNPDQVRHFVRPDLGPKCFQKLQNRLAGRKLEEFHRKILADLNHIDISTIALEWSKLHIAYAIQCTIVIIHYGF